jgi:hypothetical protein
MSKRISFSVLNSKLEEANCSNRRRRRKGRRRRGKGFVAFIVRM